MKQETFKQRFESGIYLKENLKRDVFFGKGKTLNICLLVSGQIDQPSVGQVYYEVIIQKGSNQFKKFEFLNLQAAIDCYNS